MHGKTMKLLLSVLVVFVASCKSPEVVSGQYFDDRWVDSIVAGETTIADVHAWFGDPVSSVESAQGHLVLTYEYRLGPAPSKSSFAETSGEPKLAGKTLVVGIVDSVVSHHSFSENEAGYVGTLNRGDR
jgi:hypothetical protein